MRPPFGVFITDQQPVHYSTYNQRKDDLIFLLNHLVCELLEEHVAHVCVPDITIKGNSLYSADPLKIITGKELFRHYNDLDAYIRHLRSVVSDPLVSAIYRLRCDRRYNLLIDFTFLNDITTVIAFNFFTKDSVCDS